MKPQQFADFTWQKRWNQSSENSAAAALTQSGGEYCLLTCMGFVNFEDDDATTLIKNLEAAVEILKDKFTRTNAEIAARELMRQSKKIAAIKVYRQIMSDNGIDVGLKEAKEFVESIKL